MTNALATRPTTDDAITVADYWNEEQKRTIREFLVPADRSGRRVEVTDAQLALFAQVCKLTNLDPFTGQIFLIPLDGSPKPFIGINGLRAIASRVPEGISSQVFWKSRGGEWEESWEGQGAPFAAMAVIKRGTSVHRAVVLMSEFPARGPNQSRPAHYIGTVAERHGLRKACPLELSRTLQAAASAGATVQETDEEPDVAPAPRQITAPKPTNGTNGTKEYTREELLTLWNRLTSRAVTVGVEWEDLIPDFALENVKADVLLENGPKLRARVEAAEAQAASAPAASAPAAEIEIDDETTDAELRETPESEAADEPHDPDAPAPEWGENPTPEQLRAEWTDLAAEALKLGIGSKAPPRDATTTQIVDAITALRPRVDAARAKAAKK